MDLDARSLRDGEELETDLCIVGAGPAAISLVSGVGATGADVMLLESGGFESEPDIQQLNAGDVEGEPYAGLAETRHRQFGGAANVWNTPVDGRPCGKLTPLDPHDLDGRGDPARSWPISSAELEPYYRAAQELCALGPYVYDALSWHDEGVPAPLPLDDSLSNRVYQVGNNEPFTARALSALRASTRVRICHHATARLLETDRGGRRVVAAQATSASGSQFRVRARTWVLAAGAVENARLLLLSGDALNLSGREWVGRCFMEHPRDMALSLTPYAPGFFESASFYDLNQSRGGTWIAGRIAIALETLRAGGLPNASVTLLPRVREQDAIGTARQLLQRTLLGKSPPLGYGWSRATDAERWYEGFQLLVNVEQRPHPDNRIVLGAKRDVMGLPLPTLHWRWQADDQAGLARLREKLAGSLASLGRVAIRDHLPVDPSAHHHAGTTRMHRNPTEGVVDPSGLAHGTDNLYVAGASVFPTCGWANPTLTIVALGLRLAEHLERER